MKRVLAIASAGLVLFISGAVTSAVASHFLTELHVVDPPAMTTAVMIGKQVRTVVQDPPPITVTDSDEVQHDTTTVTVTGTTTTTTTTTEPPPPTTTVPSGTVLPAGFTGVYFPVTGETLSCAAPLNYVTIRVNNPGVTIQDCDIRGAAQGRSRPGMIEVYASSLTIRNVTLRGDGAQQAQGVYSTANSGLNVDGLTCLDPGIDTRYDHCIYFGSNTTNFVVNNLRGTARYGGMLHLYPGGSTGTVRNSDLGASVWNVISSGAGNNVTVENSNLHHATEYAAYARDSGVITLRNSTVCGPRSGAIDGGGNTFSQTC